MVSPRTRKFAKWSAIASLLLGMARQVAYHLLTEAGATQTAHFAEGRRNLIRAAIEVGPGDAGPIPATGATSRWT